MKAQYFERHGDVDALHYGEIATPEPPPGWALLRVGAASLNYLDVFTLRGMPGIKVPFPMVTGGDCAGEIVAINGDGAGFAPGRRVLVTPAFIDDKTGHFEMLGETRPGALADYVTARIEQLIPIPDAVSDAEAASLPVAYGTAYRMLVTRGRIKAGETILILGASGGVGTACVLLAKLFGLKVIAAAGSEEKCQRLLDLGADEAYDYSEEPVDAFSRRTTGSLFRGGGFDVVVNFTGGETWAQSLRAVKRGGRLLTCGATAGYDPKTDLRFIFTAEMDIRGSTGFTSDDIAACLDLVAEGRLKPVIDQELPLSRAHQGVAMLRDRKVFGKIVVVPDA
ncbi:zinc-binding dehydrogenase [Oceaniradius stylonematis]|uniref:zinc-binding dehydrogenase n=1 Tax=Oceaniradius stylonematis TaxID=2184161 RepID=UPI00273FE33D|nr:zinc-binding dehydrogenase [Oceaniradius stylonematis]